MTKREFIKRLRKVREDFRRGTNRGRLYFCMDRQFLQTEWNYREFSAWYVKTKSDKEVLWRIDSSIRALGGKP